MSAAVTRVLAKLPEARPSAKGWSAKCPAHSDRHPSLWIKQGRKGALLKCYAGCTFDAIVSALGLSVAALFDEKKSAVAYRAPRRPTVHEIRTELAKEADEFRAHLANRGIEGRLLAHELNAIRHRSAVRLGVHLDRINVPVYDSAYGGMERDECWPAIFEWALNVAAIQSLGAPANFVTQRISPKILIAAEELAASALRSFAAPQPREPQHG